MEYCVLQEDDGRRLRDVIRSSMKVSFTALKAAKWNGGITVDGQPRTVDQVVHVGELIRVELPSQAPIYLPTPCFREIPIVYEDTFMLVVNKPAPLCSQSSARQPDDTLENILYAHYGCPSDYVYRPVNRLDKGTSGLMVVAKDAHTQQLLQKALHSDSFERLYLAVAENVPDTECGTIDMPIAKEMNESVRRIISTDGKPSITHYSVIATGNHRSLIQLKLETGRTHQIRVHLSAIGCPVCGDFLYGHELPELPGRFALHSTSLRLVHPITGQTLNFSAPLPDELAFLLNEA